MRQRGMFHLATNQKLDANLETCNMSGANSKQINDEYFQRTNEVELQFAKNGGIYKIWILEKPNKRFKLKSMQLLNTLSPIYTGKYGNCNRAK